MFTRFLIFAALATWFEAGNAVGQSAFPNGSYQPITSDGRVAWTVTETIGVPSLLGGVIDAEWGTLHDRPPEYGSGPEGFFKRYGIRLTDVATSNAMEAGLGAVWGEDPRYFRDAGQPFRQFLCALQ